METADASVLSTVLTFTQYDWFRSQEVAVSADDEAASGEGAVTHEVLTPNYAHRMADPPPRVGIRVGDAASGRPSPPPSDQPPPPPPPSGQPPPLPVANVRAVMSVADARAREGSDASLGFAVTLDRAASGQVTVDYTTVDGTAKAGEDYMRSSGTLAFSPGELEKTVAVPILDDARDEGEETFTLTLSRASGARIARAAATGTLANDDTMPRPWLARFGRTVASQVLDAVNARFAGSSSLRATVGGVELRRSRTEAALPGAVDRPYTDVSGEPRGRDRGRAFTPTARELLVGSAFHLRAEENRRAPAFAA